MRNISGFFETIENNPSIARHIALVGVPVGIIVGCSIAAYDWVVNELLWQHFEAAVAAPLLCLFPLLGMILTGLIVRLFRIRSTAMADEIVRAYHAPEHQPDYARTLPKLAASTATMGFGCSAGMEGASKWLGGSLAGWLQTKLNQCKRLEILHGKSELTKLAGASARCWRRPLPSGWVGLAAWSSRP